MNGLSTGDRLERYEILGELGSGGTARVYRARHVELGTFHAIKLLQLSVPGLHERLLSEGRIQATLKHPNVVAVTDVVRHGEAPALVMELIDGPSLDGLIARYQPSLPQVDAIAAGLLAGLRAAHAAGLVHRDLKPANVLIAVEHGRVVPKIADFGLARALDGALGELGGSHGTRAGVAMGTPAFLAPEQFRDAKSADQRADLFSVGALLYELCSGTPAFRGDNLMELYQRTSTGGYRPLREVAPAVPERMVRAVDAALRPDPTDRPATAEALLALWLDGSVVSDDAWEEAHLRLVRSLAPRTKLAEGTGTATGEVAVEVPRPAPRPTSAARTRGALGLLAVASVVASVVCSAGTLGLAWWTWPEEPVPVIVSVESAEPVVPEAAPAAPEVAAPEREDQVVERPKPGPPAPPEAGARDDAVADAGDEAGREAAPVHGDPTAAFVVVTGVERAALVRASDAAQLPPGSVAPGRYDLVVWFDQGRPTQALNLVLGSGERREVTCTPALKVCR